MSYKKQNFVDGQTLTAAQLNHMEDGIANAVPPYTESDYGKVQILTASGPAWVNPEDVFPVGEEATF